MSKIDDTIEEFNQKLADSPLWLQDVFGSSIQDMLSPSLWQLLNIGLFGWLLATWLERRHLKSMSLRETALERISVNTLRRPPACEPEASTLLIGSVVVAHDYFRTLIIAIRKLIGGSIKPYERLVERGRREALLRLKEEADARGIDRILNVRFTTSAVSGRFLRAVEMMAYGTGIKTRKDSSKI